MGRLAGKAGSVNAGGGAIAGIKSWSLDYKVATLENTAFDSASVKGFIPGLTEWSGAFEGFKDGAPTAIGSSITLTLKESETTGQVASGSAILTGWSPKTDVAGVVTYSYTFQGTGVLTIPTA